MKTKRFKAILSSLVFLLFGADPEIGQAVPLLKFAFQSGQTDTSFVKITGNGVFSPKLGYGLEALESIESTFFKSTFYQQFSVLLDDGNYDVIVTLGRPDQATETTLKTEDRRVMLAQIKVKPGEVLQEAFTVNIRTPSIPRGGPVKLNGRELGPPSIPRWDDKLTVESLGTPSGLRTLEITRNDQATTLFLAGDSTVTEQHLEPYAGWGQFLPLFFGPGTAIANHAESGLALNSFRSQRRLEKILQTLKPGDYVFIQFGHNDQKEKTPGSGPFTTYRERLFEYIRDVLAKKGKPVVVTPMERRRFKDGKPYTTLEDFAESARQVAQKEGVPMIDLHALSLELYGALGPEHSRKAFVHYPAGTFPGQDKNLEDDTHHNAYGGYQLAKCMVEGIRRSLPDLAARLRPGTPSYTPLRPDDPESFTLPPSPVQGITKPAGN